MDKHLPILQIIVPLIAAPICVLIQAPRRVLAVAIVVCWVTFAIATRLLWQVQEGVITYELGGWPAPWGIEYRLDGLSAFFAWLVAGVAALVITYAPRSVDHDIDPSKQSLFYTSYLLCMTGLMGIVVTGDLFNLFVFLEISSLSSYAMISMGRSRRALVAAFQYLVMGTIGATFILIGIGLCYQLTGSLNMSDLSRLLESYTAVGQHRTVLVAFAFLSVGISLKTALFPLHQWLPNAYACAPSIVTAFLAATATKVSVYVLLRVTFTIFDKQFAFGLMPLDQGLMALSLVGIYVASVTAIFQKNVKRLLAYSSVAQIGYIVLGIATASQAGVTAGILHAFNHALTKGGLFLAMGCFALRLNDLELEDLKGLGRRMPYTSFAWVLGGLGLIGVPVTAGFVSKWYLVVATLEGGYLVAAILVLLGSLLAVVYVWRVVEVLYFAEPTTSVERASEAPFAMLLPTYLMVGASLIFGIWTTYPVAWAKQAAFAILGAE